MISNNLFKRLSSIWNMYNRMYLLTKPHKKLSLGRDKKLKNQKKRVSKKFQIPEIKKKQINIREVSH